MPTSIGLYIQLQSAACTATRRRNFWQKGTFRSPYCVLKVHGCGFIPAHAQKCQVELLARWNSWLTTPVCNYLEMWKAQIVTPGYGHTHLYGHTTAAKRNVSIATRTGSKYPDLVHCVNPAWLVRMLPHL